MANEEFKNPNLELPPQQEYSLHSKFIKGYKELLSQGSLDNSSSPFITELRTIELSDTEREQLKISGRRILYFTSHKGFGFLSSSLSGNRKTELKTTAYIAECFSRNTNPAQPVIVSIDQFYKFVPGNPSLVQKTKIFNEIAKEQNPGKDFALIISNFTESNIFTKEVLEQIPTQHSAGLEQITSSSSNIGYALDNFSKTLLQRLLEKEKGDLNKVLIKIIEDGNTQENNAKLLLAAGLLLADRQTWQDLWYEMQTSGTPLYIIAPFIFHHAMNRLNFFWGHGNVDYEYRASASLGDNSDPPFEEPVNVSYHTGGLSTQVFESRIGPLLKSLAIRNPA